MLPRMQPADIQDYERRVQPATASLSAFSNQLVDELDLTDGAFPWWAGHADWKPLTLIADYLIQSVMGASEALVSASFSAKTHREALYAESWALTKAWRELAQSGETNIHAFTAAMPRDATARRRSLAVTQSSEDCLYHLGQTLDRLACALIIVGGFAVSDVVSKDWGHVAGTPSRDGLVADLAANDRIRVQPSGTVGRTLQTDLLAPVTASDSYGVPGWLEWMRDTRNAMTHRSPATKINLLLGSVNSQLRVARVFYRQPRWSEVQSLVFGTGQGASSSLLDGFVLRSSEDVLDGLCEAMKTLVVALVDAMVTTWEARRANPGVISQPGCQWVHISPAESPSAFQGWGEDISASFQGDSVMMRDGRRWIAARVMDDRRSDWTAP
jgi:hypothetical protein